MIDLLGSYYVKKDLPVRLNNCVFTLSEKSIIAVVQVDEERNKALIEFGPRESDWFHQSFLKNFEKVI